MQTSPVLNQANLQAPPASAAKASGADGSITPFNQMLSREMADRHDAAQTQDPQQVNSAPPAKPADAAGAKNAKDAKASDDKSGDAAKTDNTKTDAAASTDAAAQAPADMLALVANLNQVRQDAKTVPGAASGATGAAVAADGKKAPPSAIALSDAAAAGANGQKGADPLAAAASGSGQAQLKAAPDTPAANIKAAAELTAKEQETLDAATSATPAKNDFSAALKDTLANAQAPQSVQQAALPLAQAAPAPGADKLAPPVGSPGWDQALGQKVVWMVAGGQQSASLTLNPPDLGPMQVVLSVHNSTAHATFTAAQPEVRQALEAAMPKLRDMLGNAGIQLGQANVNSGSSNQHAPDRQPAPGARSVGRVDGGSEAPLRVGRVQPATSGRGLVDTFV